MLGLKGYLDQIESNKIKHIASSFIGGGSKPVSFIEKAAKKPKGKERWITIRGKHILVDIGTGNVVQGGSGFRTKEGKKVKNVGKPGPDHLGKDKEKDRKIGQQIFEEIGKDDIWSVEEVDKYIKDNNLTPSNVEEVYKYLDIKGAMHRGDIEEEEEKMGR